MHYEVKSDYFTCHLATLGKLLGSPGSREILTVDCSLGALARLNCSGAHSAIVEGERIGHLISAQA
jgi:hypothetical protein